MAQATAGTNDDTCDVLVIGGGPAGSTIAALLAELGKSVTLVDKDHHPRFHIGESLLPFNLPLFDKLGVRAAVERIGMPKYGIEFVSPHHPRPSLLEFGDAWRKDMDHSFQVRRADFDQVLLKNAVDKGATVIEGCRVTELDFLPDGGARAAGTMTDGSTRQWRARFVVDATGRDTFLANRLKLKQRNRRHESAAVYGHFAGAERLAGKAEGNISIFWFAKGWFWFIPLSDGTTSIGAVCPPAVFKGRQGDSTALLRSLIDMCPALAKRLEGATLTGPATATGNYSYDTERMSGDGFIMIGDASAFVDPVFSTGVYLAMHSAFIGADAIVRCLDRPAEAKAALRRFEREVIEGRNRFTWFIYRITSPVIRNLFMAPRNLFRMEEAILSLLAGDIARGSPIRWRLMLFKGLYYVNTGLMKLDRLFARQPAIAPRT